MIPSQENRYTMATQVKNNEDKKVETVKKATEITKIVVDQSKVIRTLPRMVKENFQAVPQSTHTDKK